MSTVQPLEPGSRYDIRVGISPDAPDEDNIKDEVGSFGYCHSYETSSRYDGPGLRIVIFTSGCLLRCTYCHNPDTWHLKDGTYVSVDHVLRRLGDFAPTIRSLGGGLTISGGEPMVQLAFTRKIFAGAKEMGLHTAIQTSGFLADRADDSYLSVIDHVLLDIKSSDPDTYRRVTGRDLAPTLRFAERLASISKPVWVRFTLVPGATDDPANVDGIARFVAPMKNVEWVEVQPFHQMGSFKWKAMGLDYKHVDTPIPSRELVKRVIGQFQAAGCQRTLIGGIDPGRSDMLDLARDIIGSQPILTAFLAIGLGYLVGQISIFGFSLGVGAVLFVGLAIGAFAPKAQITGPIGLTGLIMFLYGIGILYGRQFFEGMVGAGQKYNLLALVACLAGLLVALGLGHIFGIKIGHTLGLYAGSMTSTATLQAATRRRQEQGPLDRLLHRLSVRRHRPHPLHLFHDPDRKAEISRKVAALPHGRDFGWRTLRRSTSGRTDGESAGRPAGDDGSQGRAQYRPDRRYDSGDRRRRPGRRRRQ